MAAQPALFLHFVLAFRNVAFVSKIAGRIAFLYLPGSFCSLNSDRSLEFLKASAGLLLSTGPAHFGLP